MATIEQVNGLSKLYAVNNHMYSYLIHSFREYGDRNLDEVLFYIEGGDLFPYISVFIPYLRQGDLYSTCHIYTRRVERANVHVWIDFPS